MSAVIDWIYSHSWAITPESLGMIIDIANRNVSDPSAVSAKRDQYLKQTRYGKVRGDIAIIDVIGPIFARSNWFMDISGASSVDTLAKDFQAAMENREIKSIILNIDSPGGEVSGISEFADMIHAGRAKKEIVAHVQGIGASAAYWIASSASKIYLADTAMVGSIGVVMGFRSEKERNAKAGVKDIEIVSSLSPNKRLDPESDAGHAAILKLVDGIAGVFIKTVARNRDISIDTVLQDFGQGGMVVGEEAVKLGMADGILSFEKVMTDLSNSNHKNPGGFIMSKENENPAPAPVTYSAADLDKARAEGKAEGIKAGVEQENARIKAIESIKAPGAAAVIAECKFDTSMTKESVSVKVLEAQEAGRAKTQAALNKDGAETAAAAEGLGANAPEKPATAEGKRTLDINAAAAAANAHRGHQEEPSK